MSVMELLTTRRTYRRFAQKAVPQDVVNDIVQAVRLSSCGANRQAVRLVLVQSPEMVAKVQPLVKSGLAICRRSRARPKRTSCPPFMQPWCRIPPSPATLPPTPASHWPT